MISSSIFTGANIFIIIAICLISAVAAIVTTDVFKEGKKRKESVEDKK